MPQQCAARISEAPAQGAREAAGAPREGQEERRATTFAVLLAILGVLVGLAAAVVGRFFL